MTSLWRPEKPASPALGRAALCPSGDRLQAPELRKLRGPPPLGADGRPLPFPLTRALLKRKTDFGGPPGAAAEGQGSHERCAQFPHECAHSAVRSGTWRPRAPTRREEVQGPASSSIPRRSSELQPRAPPLLPEFAARGEVRSWSAPACDGPGAHGVPSRAERARRAPPDRPTAVASSWLCQSCRSRDLENPARVPRHTQPPAEVADSAGLGRGPWRAWRCAGRGRRCCDSLRIA